MNKKEFKELDREQMIIAFNQLKDDYSSLFDELEKEKEKYKRLQNTEAFSAYYISKVKIKNILDKFNKGEYHYIHDLMQEIQELLEEE